MKKYYKVLNVKGSPGQLLSISPVDLEYKLNKVTTPNIQYSKLFVFDNLPDAKCFKHGDVIYECEVTNPTKLKKAAWGFPYNREFWKNKKNHKKQPMELITLPKGTVVVDSVKLLSIVH